MAYTPENNPYIPGDPYSYDLKWVVDEINDWKSAKEIAEEAAGNAQQSADAAYTSANKAEAWAIGYYEGEPVEPGEPQYENNAKYYSDQAASSASDAADDAADAHADMLSAKDYADNIADPVSGIVTSWLTDHITNPSNPPVDTSLSVGGAAADAEVVGDSLSWIKGMAITGMFGPTFTDEVINNNVAIGASINVDTPSTSVGYGSIVIKHIPQGTKIKVTASGTYSLRFWSWISSANIMLSQAGSWQSSGKDGYVTEAPEDDCIFVSSGDLNYAWGFKVEILSANLPMAETVEDHTDRIEDLESIAPRIIANSLEGIVDGVAHRGLSSAAPENTAAAFKAAARAGFLAIETDIRFTADNIPVLIHDATVDRTSDGSGSVIDMTLAQLQALDFGSWFGPEFAGEQILTLDEGVALCKKLGLKMILEIKVWAAVSTLKSTIVDIINKYDYKEKIAFMYDSATGLAYMSQPNTLPGVNLMYLTSDITGTFDSEMAILKAATDNIWVAIDNNNITDAKAANIIGKGAKILVWTVDVKSAIQGMNGGITAVLSNVYNAPVVQYEYGLS